MDARPTGIEGAWVFTPRQFSDDRGIFLEWYKADVVAQAVGHFLTLAQANHSVSRRGTLRGVHFADVPPGQAKYVYCARGSVLDVVVDLRAGSPTFGRCEPVRLDDQQRRGLYLAEGLGHAFLSLEDDTAVTYLCSTPYAPEREHGVHPFDPQLGIRWPDDVEPLLSPRDAASPSLAEALGAGRLPRYDDCVGHYASLRRAAEASRPLARSGQ